MVKKTIPLVLSLLLISLINLAQDKEVFEELDKRSKQIPAYFEVPDNGVIVEIPTVDKSGKGIKINLSYKFYNKDLENNWNLPNLFSIDVSKQDYFIYKGKVSDEDRAISIDPTGTYCMCFEKKSNKIIRININDGKETIAPLKANRTTEGYVLNSFTDEDYFYLIFRDYNFGDKKNKEFEIIKINITNLEEEYYKLELPYVGESIVDADIRSWEAIGIRNDKLYFADKYAIQSREDKSFYKRVVMLGFENEILKDDYLFLGDKPIEDDFLGEICFNKFNRGMLYTYSWSKKDGKNTVLYNGYDSELNKLWEKEYPSNIKGGIQKVISDVNIKKINEDIIISHSYGKDNFVFEVNLDNTEFNFEILNGKSSRCNIPEAYRIDCSYYARMYENPKLKKYLYKDKNASEEDVDVIPIFMDDRIIIMKKSFPKRSLPDQYVNIMLFNL